MLDFCPLSFNNITWKDSIKMRNLKFGTRNEFNLRQIKIQNRESLFPGRRFYPFGLLIRSL